ncbi:Fur family transcriptional regulator [Metallosphaera hakonensis]|uniref:Transcriptional repressor n=1 Tax=Metallosphaera hakonensis JCM 8857 = DSM 7519 TaxID=1293036 RepID=A0A2U9ISE6_9CREN|nr:Fur family transcriptional regulator [Metallosphaera hakonensis]AWR98928.1 transcriptional repressor [Metallosphaera hakonensis JCM 8857 = DSM 7519]
MEIDIAEALRKKGLKVTPQRIAVIKTMIKGGHFSGEQIYSELKKTEPSISLSTVYNALETLKDAGIIRSFEAGGKTWYEMRMEPHVNVYCEDIGDIVDVDLDLSTLEKNLMEKGIEPRNLSVIVYAECSKMRKG